MSKDLSGIAGEYFVAAELSRKGFIAAVTLRNTRGADIIVSKPGRTKSATIQVKTMQTGRRRWPMSKNDEVRKGKNHYYVFVTLNGRDGEPEYYIVAGNHVAEWCAANHRKWLKGKKRDGGERRDTNMRIFCPDEDSRNAWETIAV